MVLLIVALIAIGFVFPPAWLAVVGFGIYLVASQKSRRSDAIESRVKKMVSVGQDYAVFADLYFEAARSYAIAKGAKAADENAASAHIVVDGRTYFVVFTRAASGGTIFGVEEADSVRRRIFDDVIEKRQKPITGSSQTFSKDNAGANSILSDYPILSAALGISKEDVICECRRHYNSFDLKARGSNKVRTIEAPCPHLKRVQRSLLDKILSHVEPHQTAMAFARGKSIAMNARRHHGATHLFKTDIRSFFHSITTAAVTTALEKHFLHLSHEGIKEIAAFVTLDGRLPQGAPTSPHLSNLVMYEFDERCNLICDQLGAVYTRYADDISISSNDADVLLYLEVVVRDGIRALNMKTHPVKTKHYGPNQRKTVTGLDIGNPCLRPTRAFRKKTAALVRMSIKYPEKMNRHHDRITGYLAFWYDVYPADPDLTELLLGMGLIKWARRISAAADLDEEIPF